MWTLLQMPKVMTFIKTSVVDYYIIIVMIIIISDCCRNIDYENFVSLVDTMVIYI